jgi:hypothetical protein
MHGRPVGLARGPEGSYRANSVVGRARAETALLTELEMSLVASLDLDREKPVESNQISFAISSIHHGRQGLLVVLAYTRFKAR